MSLTSSDYYAWNRQAEKQGGATLGMQNLFCFPPLRARAQGHAFRLGLANVVLSSRRQPARKLTDTLCWFVFLFFFPFPRRVPVGEVAECHADPALISSAEHSIIQTRSLPPAPRFCCGAVNLCDNNNIAPKICLRFVRQ